MQPALPGKSGRLSGLPPCRRPDARPPLPPDPRARDADAARPVELDGHDDHRHRPARPLRHRRPGGGGGWRRHLHLGGFCPGRYSAGHRTDRRPPAWRRPRAGDRRCPAAGAVAGAAAGHSGRADPAPPRAAAGAVADRPAGRKQGTRLSRAARIGPAGHPALPDLPRLLQRARPAASAVADQPRQHAAARPARLAAGDWRLGWRSARCPRLRPVECRGQWLLVALCACLPALWQGPAALSPVHRLAAAASRSHWASCCGSACQWVSRISSRFRHSR
jgi:hypothetical protein